MNKFKKIFEEFIEVKENSIFIINTKEQDKYIEFMSEDGNSCRVFDALKEKVVTPYYPFLYFIKDFFGEKLEEEIESVISKSKVYYFYQNVFKDFILGREIVKNEELLSEEINYEKNEIYNSIKNLLNQILNSNRENVLFIKNANFLPESSLYFIKWVLENCKREKFIIILSFENNIVNGSEEISEIWEGILEKGEEKALNYNSEEVYQTNLREGTLKKNKDTEYTIEEIIKYSSQCCNFLAFEESKRILSEFIQKIEEKDVSNVEKMKIYNLAGDSFLMLLESDKALWNYNIAIEYGIETNNEELLYEIYRNMAEAHNIKQNYEMAEKYCEKSLKMAMKSANERSILKSYYLIFLIKSHMSIKELWKIKYIFEKIEDLAEKLKMYNLLSRCYGIAVSEYEFYRNNEVRLEYCLKAIKIAFKCGNKNRIASLYHNLGVIYMGMGNKEKSFEYYKKSERLKIKLGIKNEIAKIYNGIGYDMLLAGNFKDSFFNFEKALEYLTNEKEYAEIVLTFYNIAVLFFLMGKYEKVNEYLKNIITIMKILNIKKMQFHSNASIYALLSIAAIKQKRYMKSLEYYNTSKLEPEIYSEEEYIYIYLMNGMILNEEKSYKEAVDEFKKIGELQKKIQSKILIAKFYSEYEKFLRDNKKIKEYEKIKKEREKFCEENGIKEYDKIFNEEHEKREERFFNDKSFDIKSVVEFAKQERNINTIHKKRAEEKLLINVHQLLLKNEKESKKVVDEITTLIKNNFIVEESMAVLFQNGNGVKQYSYDISEEKDKIWKFLNSLKDSNKSMRYCGEKILTVAEKYGIHYNSIITIPLKNREKSIGVFMFATKNPELVLNEEDERILSIIINHFAMALVNIELNSALENKNRVLLNALEKVKSMENMVSVIHTEKDKQRGINYILNILVSEHSFMCKKAFYLNYLENEEALFVAGSSETEENIQEALNSIKIKTGEKNEISKVFTTGEKSEGYSESGIITYIFGIKSFKCIPVSYQDRKYGVLLVENRDESIEDLELNEDILNIAAANLGIYLENKKFHKEILKSEKLKAVVEFSKAIVHELRTPLSGIKGFAKIEKRRHPNDDRTERNMNEIISGAEKIDEMAGELLYYVSDEAANTELILVKEAAELVIKELNEYIVSENIDITLSISENTAVLFEMEQLKKVIREIIKNSIEAAADDNPKIWISAAESEDKVEIIIKDNGIGMDAKELKIVDEPLSTSKIQGKGMGIPIIKSILKRHNGQLQIESVKGEWTEAKVTVYREVKSNEHNSF